MRNQTIISLFIMLLSTNYCKSQYVDSATLNKLINQNSLPYMGENGRPLSEKPLEASSIKVVFYSFYLSKAQSKAIIKGRIIDPSVKEDSIGLRNYIFLATPIGNKLTKIRIFKQSYDRKADDSHENKFPYMKGDFLIEFKFNQNERLYFNSEMSDLVEYDIGKLLNQK